jgi:hypothetical protein
VKSIRERNRRVEKLSGVISKNLPKLDDVHLGGGLDANTVEKQEAMTDILVSALITRLTNVVTFKIDELSTPIKGLPGNEGDHISSHEIGHIKQIATIIERLEKVPEGKGSLSRKRLNQTGPIRPLLVQASRS